MASDSTGQGGALAELGRGLARRLGRPRPVAGWDHRAFRESGEALERHGGCGRVGARVLDLGCGRRFPAALLFHTFGARVTGIDADVFDPAFGAGSWLRMIRVNGVERFARSLAQRVLFDRAYYRELGRLAGRPLRFEGLDLRLMDAGALGFPDAHFDLVHSNSVFEHLADVPAAVREVARVLRPTGVASIVIHLFPSLSGGHHPDWAFPDEEPSRRVPPWDHLRARRHPAGVRLNRWREREFLAEFERRFAVLESQAFVEGERLLTPGLERELSAYPREELLKRAVRLVLRPRAL